MMNYKLLTCLLSVFMLSPIRASIYDVFGAENISPLFKDMERRFASIEGIPNKIGNPIAQKIIADNPRINEAAKTFKVLRGHTNYVDSVAWSPDGAHLASGSADGTITIWNMAGDSPQLLQTFKDSRDKVLFVAWSPDETKLASISQDAEVGFVYEKGLQNTTINIWDTKTWQIIKTFDGAFIKKKSIAWSPDGKYFAWASKHEQTLKIWDTESWELVKEFTGVTLTSVAWSPDGKKLAADRNRGFITMWDTTSWEILPLDNYPYVAGVSDGFQLIAWSPDSQLLAFHDFAHIRIFDVNSGKVVQELSTARRGEYSEMCWSPDGKQFAYQESDWFQLDKKGVRRFDILVVQDTTKWPRMHVTPREMAREIRPIFKIQDLGYVRFSSLGWNSNSSFFTAINDKKVKMWDVKTGELVQEFEGDANINSCVWSPNGRQIAVVEGNIIKILNIALLDNKDIQNITLEQALLLKLLYAKNIALRYQWVREKRTNPDAKLVDSIDLASIHDQLPVEEAQQILSTFSDEARNRIIKRYNIVGYTSSPKRENDENAEKSPRIHHHGGSAAASSSVDAMDTN